MQLQKTSAWKNLFIFKASLLCANHFFLINHTRKLYWNSNLNEPQRKNFVLIISQLSAVGIQLGSELLELLIQMSSLFIHVTNFKITIINLNSKSQLQIFKILKVASPIFYYFLFFHQVIALQKLWKMFFISSKKFFLCSRYSYFCNLSCSFPLSKFKRTNEKE